MIFKRSDIVTLCFVLIIFDLFCLKGAHFHAVTQFVEHYHETEEVRELSPSPVQIPASTRRKSSGRRLSVTCFRLFLVFPLKEANSSKPGRAVSVSACWTVYSFYFQLRKRKGSSWHLRTHACSVSYDESGD